MWKELEVAEKAAKIAERYAEDYGDTGSCADRYESAVYDTGHYVAKKIREELGLPSYNLPSLYDIVNESGL